MSFADHVWNTYAEYQRSLECKITQHPRECTYCYTCSSLVNFKSNWKYSRIVPEKLGGSNEIHNIRITCEKCNVDMNTETLEEFAIEKGNLNSIASIENIKTEKEAISIYKMLNPSTSRQCCIIL